MTEAIALIPNPARAAFVKARISEIKSDLVERSLELGRLLKECRDNDYPSLWGFNSYGSWVEDGSGLDMSERQSYYLINIVERSTELGISDEELQRVKLSKLKEIFSLKEDNNDVVKELVTKAEKLSLSEVREMVQMLKIANGAEPFVYVAFKMPSSVRDIKNQAFEHCRKLYGNYEGGVEIPDWKCLELCCVSMLNDQGEGNQATENIIEASFEDVVEDYVASVEG